MSYSSNVLLAFKVNLAFVFVFWFVPFGQQELKVATRLKKQEKQRVGQRNQETQESVLF